jgi:hypothetical protein
MAVGAKKDDALTSSAVRAGSHAIGKTYMLPHIAAPCMPAAGAENDVLLFHTKLQVLPRNTGN